MMSQFIGPYHDRETAPYSDNDFSHKIGFLFSASLKVLLLSFTLNSNTNLK
jgi:hypothetical protein